DSPFFFSSRRRHTRFSRDWSSDVCSSDLQGREIIGLRLNFSKRYITLAPVATVIGLAFRMFDPDGLLGDRKDIGITCALIPRNKIGRASCRERVETSEVAGSVMQQHISMY